MVNFINILDDIEENFLVTKIFINIHIHEYHALNYNLNLFS